MVRATKPKLMPPYKMWTTTFFIYLVFSLQHHVIYLPTYLQKLLYSSLLLSEILSRESSMSLSLSLSHSFIFFLFFDFFLRHHRKPNSNTQQIYAKKMKMKEKKKRWRRKKTRMYYLRTFSEFRLFTLLFHSIHSIEKYSF